MSWLPVGGLVLAACGGAKSSPAQTPADEASPPREDAELVVEVSDEAALSDSLEAKSTADAAPASDEPPPPLEVRYYVSSEGLRVTVSGVELVPEATPVRVGNGWGVRIDVKARSRDDRPHVLFQPEQGPIAFFAVVERGGADGGARRQAPRRG